jgi:hypothetical protein
MSIENQLQGLINKMQEDADRVVATWSGIGDAILRHQDNQKAILAEIASICQHGLGRPQQSAQPVYAQQPQMPTGQHYAPIGYAAGPAPGYATGQPTYAPSNAPLANGYDNHYYPETQGYPPQPYQQKDAAPETHISQVLKNLRRTG